MLGGICKKFANTPPTAIIVVGIEGGRLQKNFANSLPNGYNSRWAGRAGPD